VDHQDNRKGNRSETFEKFIFSGLARNPELGVKGLEQCLRFDTIAIISGEEFFHV
jgi:hypothetical protein